MLSSKFLTLSKNNYKVKSNFEQIPNLVMRYDLLQSKIDNNPATDKLIRIRRSNDNSEKDIVIDRWGRLDVFAIESFVPTGNSIHVVNNYNNTRGGYDAFQTTSVNQPLLLKSDNFNGDKYSLSYAGANTRLDISNETIYTDISISAWVNLSSYVGGGLQSICGTQLFGTSYGLEFRFNASTNTLNMILTGGGSSVEVNSVRTFSTADIGKWFHVATTYNSGTKVLNLYIDGIYSNGATGGVQTFNTRLSLGTDYFHVGNGYNGVRPLLGKLSDFRFYNRSLTASEIQKIYLER